MDHTKTRHLEDTANQDQHHSDDPGSLPPRMVKHAGKKTKLVRYYSITLLWLFFLLTLFLILWGYRNT
jgi:hypothetical protein